MKHRTPSRSAGESRKAKATLIRGLPFAVRLPNRTTRKTLAGTDAGRNVVQVKDEPELFERLEL